MLRNYPNITAPTKLFVITWILLLTILLTSCSSNKDNTQPVDGKMYHIQQVLEYYDIDGNPIPQYLEFWLAKDQGKCLTLDAAGNILTITLDTQKNHIRYEPTTRTAIKATESLLFRVDYDAMSKIYTKESYADAGQYADRLCHFYLLENAAGDQWMKLYVDQSTGYTLFSDTENFSLKTALFEELPLDESLFVLPDDLVYKEGE